MAGKVNLTKVQDHILAEAQHCSVRAIGHLKRSCDLLVHMGLLEKHKGRWRAITPAGRAHLASSGKDD